MRKKIVWIEGEPIDGLPQPMVLTYQDVLPSGYTQAELDQILNLSGEEIHQWALSAGRTYTSVYARCKQLRKQYGFPPPKPRKRF